jgi:hypothetical protein
MGLDNLYRDSDRVRIKTFPLEVFPKARKRHKD